VVTGRPARRAASDAFGRALECGVECDPHPHRWAGPLQGHNQATQGGDALGEPATTDPRLVDRVSFIAHIIETGTNS
jgi:hypothetical protein